MNKLTILFCLMLFAEGILKAQDEPCSIEAGLLLYSYNYEEKLPPLAPSFDKETGFLPGVFVSFRYQGSSLPLFGQILYEYTNSSTEYNGHMVYSSAGHITLTPLSTTTNDIFQRIEFSGGYSFRFAKTFTLVPYGGYGYRSWARTITGTGGGEEDYSWSYIPIGVRSEYHSPHRWSAGVDIAMRIMFGGSITMHQFDNITQDLGSVIGFRLSFPCSYSLAKAWSLGIDPWYESSGIGSSSLQPLPNNPKVYVKEPDSSTSIYGVSLCGRFSF